MLLENIDMAAPAGGRLKVSFVHFFLRLPDGWSSAAG
jgi:hypothetical protein